jgi:beta-glucosidase/6-phospho-beta-glucosidase/beta-galactosidase
VNPFQTFFMGGYECADHLNRYGERINLLMETQHDIRVEEDYELLSSIGIKVVREGICWSQVEKIPGYFDFSEVLSRMEAAERYGIQQIWDLIHFGYPDGIYPTHPTFCARFLSLCHAFANFYITNSKQPLFVVPINEISFLSWLSGEVRGTVPYGVNAGFDIKYHLCKAAILGIRVLKEAIPACRIILVEPLVTIHSPLGVYDPEIVNKNEHQYQAMDMIAGRMCPELGGDESLLDILGLNYYWNCQWEDRAETLPWPANDGRRKPLSDLLENTYKRYGRPIFLSETGHFGCGRVPWLEEVTSECMKAIQRGVVFYGICIYPVTDRPDWDDLSRYSNCGIWDLNEAGDRIPEVSFINAIASQQDFINGITCS